MIEIKLKDGRTARPYQFMVKGFRMTVWARTQQEAIKRAEKLWANPVPIMPN